MLIVLRFFGVIFTAAVNGAVCAVLIIGGVIWTFSRDLPDPAALAAYEPFTLSRVYSGEGDLMDEFARERRIFTPADEIPPLVKAAFISAEDKHFYQHGGFDPLGILKALADYAKGDKLRGASTITQQVMKTFLLSGERSGERKIKEIILATRLEQALSKDQILELYLNEIFLGQNAYGVTAAAQVYFAKTLEELTPAEAAYLASLPKAPSERHPVHDREAAVWWRNNTLREMAENGYITAADAAAAEAAPFATVQGGEIASARSTMPPRGYFTEEIRRQLGQRLGEDRLLGGGLAVRATIDPDLQEAAAAALRKRLEVWDRSHGKWRGPVDRLDPADLADDATWRTRLSTRFLPRDIPGWRLAVVLELVKTGARIGVEGVPARAEGAFLTLKDAAWTGRKKPEDLWKPGDVVLVRETRDDAGNPVGWSLRQIPEIQGGLMAMDPQTGRVLAMMGGFSYQQSVFNRATQATRQPGSSFKPFVYSAAMDAGYSPATIVLDAPVTVETGAGTWTPQNASGEFYGPSPMRIGLEKSRNLMTVRIAQTIGMDKVAQVAETFGIYDDMPEHLAYALGAGETTLWRMVTAYAMIANGGRRLEPTLVDRVQDRRGRTIYRHDQRPCDACAAEDYKGGAEPLVRGEGEEVMDPVTNWRLISMMKGVVLRGTAKVLAPLKLNLAGKTGTTNDSKDVWFIGFTPNIVVGCYIGYDQPRPMGKGASGGELCAPAVKDFLEVAMKTRPNTDFRQPPGTVLVRTDLNSGIRQPDNAKGANIVLDLYRIGEEPGIYAAADVMVGDETFVYSGDLPLETSDDAFVSSNTAPASIIAPPPSTTQLSVGSGGLY